MTPGEIIALIRDVAIVGALGAAIWMLVHLGADQVKLADLKALQRQLQANANQEQTWRRNADVAQAQSQVDMEHIRALVAGYTAPVLVCPGPSRSGPVSAAPAQTSNNPAGAGGTDPGAGRDIRPQIAQFELKYESALNDCRKAVASWP